MITKSDFGGCALYTLTSKELQVSVMELGATVTNITFRGKTVGLGYATAEEYRKGTAYLGAIVGRFANRIGGGAFTLNGQRYELSRNEGGNTLHGGADSFDKRCWQGEILGDSVRFTLRSPAGDNGFPGALTAIVSYTVAGSELRIDFEGESDADTVYAPTTHMYFNLNDGGSVLDTVMQIEADAYLEPGEGLIPTGRVLPTEGDFDFSRPRVTGRNYDHCFILKGERACIASGGGTALTLWTDYPALQYYTGEFLGQPFGENGGFAIEPEFYPDSPNHSEFPSATLRAGERFHQYAIYRFETTE